MIGQDLCSLHAQKSHSMGTEKKGLHRVSMGWDGQASLEGYKDSLRARDLISSSFSYKIRASFDDLEIFKIYRNSSLVLKGANYDPSYG